MIAGATRGAGGPALARHLLKRQEGQEVIVMPARHLAAEDLSGQIRELVAIAARGRTDRPIHHVHIDPPPDCIDPDSVIATFLDHYESEFGLESSQRCGVYHTKNGRRHAHVVWSLVREDGSVLSLAHDHARREKVSRITEFECGLPMTMGKHNRSAAAALRKEGRADVADAMLAAGLLDGRRPVAHSTPRQRAQAERTAVPLDEMRNHTFAAWNASDDAKTFAVALHAFDFVVATGERGYVLVDRSGNVHSLNRVLAAAARAAGAERIRAAAVRTRLAGIRFPTIEEVRNVRSNRRNSESSDRSAPEFGAPVAALGPSERVVERDESDRRTEGPAIGNHRDSWTPYRSVAPARKRIRDRTAAKQLSGIDLQAINTTKGKIMATIKAQKFKAGLLAMIAPRGFNAHAFSDDLRMIKMPSPGSSTARIMCNDGGWIELDSRSGSVRTWGPTGRASVLAAALASKLGVEVEHLAKAASFGADSDALKVVKLSEDTIKDLASWWIARGYTATAAPDGAWINVGWSRLHDTGDRLTVHGALTDEAITATIVKAKEAWGGSMTLTGSWTQHEQDRLWIAAQRAGVEIANCSPSKSIQETWQREQGRAITRQKTISAVRTEMVGAQDLLDAARGDQLATLRLPGPLQAFVAIYLDDEQRKELAAQSVAEVLPELQRFRELGAVELAEYERTGRKFAPAKPEQSKRGDDNTYSPR